MTITSPNWKQVTPAECLKWQIDNPMKEAKCSRDDYSALLRMNPTNKRHEYKSSGNWRKDSEPTCEGFTYFIPEVTE